MMKKDRYLGVDGRSRFLQKLVDKMNDGKNHIEAVNEILNEESPGPPFDLKRRQEINNVLFATKDAAKIVQHHEKPKKYDVLTLDVWGNEEDGFEVNNASRAGSITIPAMSNEEDILKLLKNDGYLESSVRPNHISIESSDDNFIEINAAKNGEPLLQLSLSE